jgi:hypothetical protein
MEIRTTVRQELKRIMGKLTKNKHLVRSNYKINKQDRLLGFKKAVLSKLNKYSSWMLQNNISRLHNFGYKVNLFSSN